MLPPTTPLRPLSLPPPHNHLPTPPLHLSLPPPPPTISLFSAHRHCLMLCLSFSVVIMRTAQLTYHATPPFIPSPPLHPPHNHLHVSPSSSPPTPPPTISLSSPHLPCLMQSFLVSHDYVYSSVNVSPQPTPRPLSLPPPHNHLLIPPPPPSSSPSPHQLSILCPPSLLNAVFPPQS